MSYITIANHFSQIPSAVTDRRYICKNKNPTAGLAVGLINQVIKSEPNRRPAKQQSVQRQVQI